jgi:hypothetical protein
LAGVNWHAAAALLNGSAQVSIVQARLSLHTMVSPGVHCPLSQLSFMVQSFESALQGMPSGSGVQPLASLDTSQILHAAVGCGI